MTLKWSDIYILSKCKLKESVISVLVHVLKFQKDPLMENKRNKKLLINLRIVLNLRKLFEKLRP